MIEQGPAAFAIRGAFQENFEGVVPLNTNAARAPMPKQIFHFRRPLRMRRPAQTKTIREQAGPKLPRPSVAALVKANSPQIFSAFFPVRVMCVAPIPRGQRFLFI